MRILFSVLLFLSAASAAGAVDQARVNLFVKLVQDNGCRMDDATASRVLPANKFTRKEVSDIEKHLDKKGMIDKSQMGVFALTKAACKG